MTDTHKILAVHITDRLKDAVDGAEGLHRVRLQHQDAGRPARRRRRRLRAGRRGHPRARRPRGRSPARSPAGSNAIDGVEVQKIVFAHAPLDDRPDGATRGHGRASAGRTERRARAPSATCSARSPCRPTRLLRRAHRARPRELRARRAAGARRARPRLRHGQARRRAAPTATSASWADDPAKADAIERACRELADGAARRRTSSSTACRAAPAPSTNMNVNEVLANRALRAARRAARRLRPRLAARRRQPPPVAPTTPSPPPCAWPPSACCTTSRSRCVALQEAFQAKEKRVRPRRQGRPHAAPGRRAHHARPRDGRLRRGAQPRPLAHLQMRGAPARGQPRRHGHRHRLRRAAAVHLPRRRHAARAHRRSASPAPRT